MFRVTSFHRLMSILLSILFIRFFFNTSKIFAQEQEQPLNKELLKPKVIFNNQVPDSTVNFKSTDTTKAKVIFNKSFFLRKDAIRLISSTQFELHGEERMVGDRGQFLIEAMNKNQRAIDGVHQAYKTKDTGTTLMVLAGVGFVVGLLTIPTVELGQEQSGNTVTTYYWLPPVTIAAILGGIGYAKHSSLEKKLDDAVKIYNDDLINQKQDDLSK